MKIAISGKGGVGKTTLAALLCHILTERDYRVLAIDADPDANLATALGFPPEKAPKPISEMADLVLERTGAKPGTSGSFFTMNPKVDDIPDTHCVEHGGIRLMRMGTVKKGGGGCVCPESTLLRALTQHLIIERRDSIVLDMEAGLEHLGRGTAMYMDRLIVVVEPGRRSIETAEKIRQLAADIKLEKIGVVGNKVRNDRDKEFLEETLADYTILGFIPFSPSVLEADMESRAAFDVDSATRASVEEIVSKLL